MSLLDLLLFIREHDTNEKACGEWRDYDILKALQDAQDAKTLLVSTTDGRITGICVGVADKENKRMFIPFIVTDEAIVLPIFIGYFLLNYPYWKLEGQRNGVLREWTPSAIDKLLSRIVKFQKLTNANKG